MKKTSQSELKTLLVDLGLAPGDKIFVHAFLPSLGIVEGGLNGIFEVIFDHIGKHGTLIVPTFTASYRRNEIYDVKESKSFNGAFSEYVRNMPTSVRSLDPLFSMAAIGMDSEILMQRTGKSCFGRDSVYEKLFHNNVKFIGFGVDWDQGYSFFMHLECLANVPYRQDKVYQGSTRLEDGTLTNDQAIHFVRHEGVLWNRKRGPLCEQLLAEDSIRQVTFGGCHNRIFESSIIKRKILEHLKSDVWCMTDYK
jgi:aminoglycoside 3-N-acetyltransferase